AKAARGLRAVVSTPRHAPHPRPLSQWERGEWGRSIPEHAWPHALLDFVFFRRYAGEVVGAAEADRGFEAATVATLGDHFDDAGHQRQAAAGAGHLCFLRVLEPVEAVLEVFHSQAQPGARRLVLVELGLEGGFEEFLELLAVGQVRDRSILRD